VTRAVIGAGSSGAGTTLVAREALALTRVTVANTTVGALGILVARAKLVGGINPSDVERADTIRTIARKMRQTQTPVVVALANTLKGTFSVARAAVVTTGLNDGKKRC